MKRKAMLLNIIGLICAIISIATAWWWPFYLNVWVALPALLLGVFVTFRARRLYPGNRFSQINLGLYGLAILSSVLALFLFMGR
ncbi:MAG: hypothetical protein R3359_02625 [Marinirhabdus sp.]|nr:hypothetical protein [Marinirhabdus sp.]